MTIYRETLKMLSLSSSRESLTSIGDRRSSRVTLKLDTTTPHMLPSDRLINIMKASSTPLILECSSRTIVIMPLKRSFWQSLEESTLMVMPSSLTLNSLISSGVQNQDLQLKTSEELTLPKELPQEILPPLLMAPL